MYISISKYEQLYNLGFFREEPSVKRMCYYLLLDFFLLYCCLAQMYFFFYILHSLKLLHFYIYFNIMFICKVSYAHLNSCAD